MLFLICEIEIEKALEKIDYTMKRLGIKISSCMTFRYQISSGETFVRRLLLRFPAGKKNAELLLSFLQQQESLDFFLLSRTQVERNYRLLVFDMDSTFINAEVINLLAEEAGVRTKIAAITAAAMNGELDFTASLKERVACLKGLREEVLRDVSQHLILNCGVIELVRCAQKKGLSVGLLSGGFTFFSCFLQEKYRLDFTYANQLEIKEGRLTGNVIGDVVDAEQKCLLLNQVCQEKGIALEQAIAVGDGANDLPMLRKAGIGVAYHPKPIVRRQAPNAIFSGSMDLLRLLFSFTDSPIDD